jgi:hypothetical protein
MLGATANGPAENTHFCGPLSKPGLSTRTSKQMSTAMTQQQQPDWFLHAKQHAQKGQR